MNMADFMKTLNISHINIVGVVEDFIGPTGYLDQWQHPVLRIPSRTAISGEDTKGRRFVYVNMPGRPEDEYEECKEPWERVNDYMIFQRYAGRDDFWVCNVVGAAGTFEEVLDDVVNAERQ